MNNKEFQELIDKQPVYALNWLAVVYSKLFEEIGELQERISKAIEYIEDNTYKSNETEYMDLTGIRELLDILKGVDKE